MFLELKNSINAMVVNLKEVISKIKEPFSIVSFEVNEIISGNADLNQRMEEQASVTGRYRFKQIDIRYYRGIGEIEF